MKWLTLTAAHLDLIERGTTFWDEPAEQWPENAIAQVAPMASRDRGWTIGGAA